MSRKQRTHLRGKRGQAFADQIRGIPLDRILCVSLDISKYFHVVMIHNGLGEIVTPTFEIDIFQSGFDRLCQALEDAVAQTKAPVVLVGMEPTSHYFENLARHLRAVAAGDVDQQLRRQGKPRSAADASREDRRD